MLLQEHVDKIDKFICLSETREEEVLLQFLVIIFDEFADDFGRVGQRLRRDQAING